MARHHAFLTHDRVIDRAVFKQRGRGRRLGKRRCDGKHRENTGNDECYNSIEHGFDLLLALALAVRLTMNS